MSGKHKMLYKFVTCGDIVEVYGYKVPVRVGETRKHNIIKSLPDENTEKRKDNLYRARQTVRRIIWSNQSKYTKFVTLTYAKTILDLNKVKRNITTFVQAMRRLGYDMKYLYVLEHQKERGLKEGNEGCLHIHMIIFIDQYIPYQDLNKCWKYGQTDINAIDDVRNLGAYVCKYITKENIAEFGMRSFSCSLGLDHGKVERFYVGQYSDTVTNVQGDDILKGLNLTYSSTVRYDYIQDNGEVGTQTVEYMQGTWKDKDLIKELDPLYDLKRQIDDLHIPKIQ